MVTVNVLDFLSRVVHRGFVPCVEVNEMCNCIDMTNQALKDRGWELEVGITFGETPSVFLPIHTKLIDDAPVGKGHRKKSAPILLPSYCPFCGKKVTNENSS